jgi:hypothetical protein
MTLTGLPGGLNQLAQGLGRRPDQVRPPVQHANVNEPGECKEGVLPAIGDDRRGEESRGIGLELVERENPPCRGKFRRPDGVQLEDVWIARPGVQPLDV